LRNRLLALRRARYWLLPRRGIFSLFVAPLPSLFAKASQCLVVVFPLLVDPEIAADRPGLFRRRQAVHDQHPLLVAVLRHSREGKGALGVGPSLPALAHAIELEALRDRVDVAALAVDLRIAALVPPQGSRGRREHGERLTRPPPIYGALPRRGSNMSARKGKESDGGPVT
jgi:hypothetical protein